jgi:hypothetical protein
MLNGSMYHKNVFNYKRGGPPNSGTSLSEAIYALFHMK